MKTSIDETPFAAPQIPYDTFSNEPTPSIGPRSILTDEELAERAKPTVLIVGAGIGGLMLGQLLLKGGIPFEILERAKEVKPLASLLRQLGLYEQFKDMGKPNNGWTVFTEDLLPMHSLDMKSRVPMCDAEEYIVSRPDLCALLMDQIPKERIHLNKKVLSYLQNSNGVLVRCSDNTCIHGDILVGADGAHSAVRQLLFRDLMAKGMLPDSDNVPLPFDSICLVGQTEVLDPEEFPELKLPHSFFHAVIGRDGYTQSVFTTKRGTICWTVAQFLNKDTAKEHDAFRNSEWGPESAETMCKIVRDFRVPGGKGGKLTVGDLIDRTPKHLISKVMLEEKVFQTWYGGRTVLLGDACHKLNPSGAAGALSAIHDAVALANWICTLQNKSLREFEKICKEYRAERFPVVQEAFKTSQFLKNSGAKNFTGAVTRAIFRRMPTWLWRSVLKKTIAARPQVWFLPLVDDKGSIPPILQPSLLKTMALIKQRSKKMSVEAKAATKANATKISS
ncbi:hypothetical protein BG004_001698 [Podila humilis]|nr:hypothetical protein BG004_001698 [Podila humilis]